MVLDGDHLILHLIEDLLSMSFVLLMAVIFY